MKVLAAATALAVAAVVIPQGSATAAAPVTAAATAPAAVLLPAARAEFKHKVKVKVTEVVDGDTIAARTTSGKRLYVRTAGINTPEKTQCGNERAERMLRRELRKNRTTVELRYDRAKYTLNRASGRYRLSASIYAGGVDTATALLAAGLALPFNYGNETHNQRDYGPITETAALNHRGLFGPMCSPVSSPAISIIFKNDGHSSSYSDRWLYLHNNSTVPVNLTGWALKVGGRNERVLPAGTVVAPGQNFKVMFGGQASQPGQWLWASVVGQLPVWRESKYAYGGVYLSDHQGRIQSWSMTPCTLSCDRRLDGTLRLGVSHSPKGPNTARNEYASVTNVSGQPQNLSYLIVKIRNLVHQVPAGTILQPRQTLYVHPGYGKSGNGHTYLNNGLKLPPVPFNGLAYIATHNGHFLDCFSWGLDRCPV